MKLKSRNQKQQILRNKPTKKVATMGIPLIDMEKVVIVPLPSRNDDIYMRNVRRRRA